VKGNPGGEESLGEGRGMGDAVKNLLPLHRKVSHIRLMRYPSIFLAVVLSANLASAADKPWQPLFNGTDFTGWDTYLSKPDPTWNVPGLQRDAQGNYLQPVGLNNDPLKVFTVENVDGGPVIHVSGEGFGVLETTGSFTNYHLRLQFKWGERRWSKKIGKLRDTGLLYYCQTDGGKVDNNWPLSTEFQIQEHNTGDLYALGMAITVNADLVQSVPGLTPETNRKPLYPYDPKGTPTVFIQKKPVSNRCIKLVDAENPTGQWNTLDLIVCNGDSIHIVNGKVVMRLRYPQRLDNGVATPLTGPTRISLQSEGGECYFRNVELQPISRIPPEYAVPNLGYSDTPLIPGTPWHVHDGDRPQPPIVTPARTFSLLAPPPSDAKLLFDGADLSQWEDDTGGPASWKVHDGYVEAIKGGLVGIRTKETFPDFQLHLEYMEPPVVEGEGQGRGNSGVLINNMYEVQILDSYNNPTYPDGQAGALYGQLPPLVNACKPPGEWQSYDIIWEAPLWDATGNLIKKANVTVIQNGVVLHHKSEFFGRTDGIGGIKHKSLGAYSTQHPPDVFVELQDHKNAVRFRNIWIRNLGQYDPPPPAAAASP